MTPTILLCGRSGADPMTDVLTARGWQPVVLPPAIEAAEEFILAIAAQTDLRAAVVSTPIDATLDTALSVLRALATPIIETRPPTIPDSKWAEGVAQEVQIAICPGYRVPVFDWANTLRTALQDWHPSRGRVLVLDKPDALVCGDNKDTDSYYTVVLAALLPHDGRAEGWLVAARDRLAPGGSLIFACRSGVGPEVDDAFCCGAWIPARIGGIAPRAVDGYARVGLEIVLSRADLEVDCIEPLPLFGRPDWGWAVCARQRPERLSEFAQRRRQRREEAAQLNGVGEDRFATGDTVGALKAFAAAVALWDREALFHNNLATALHVLGHNEDAWARLLDGLHLAPGDPALRENLAALAVVVHREAEAQRILDLFPIPQSP